MSTNSYIVIRPFIYIRYLIFSIYFFTFFFVRSQIKTAIISIRFVTEAIGFSLILFLYIPKVDSKISDENRTFWVSDNNLNCFSNLIIRLVFYSLPFELCNSSNAFFAFCNVVKEKLECFISFSIIFITLFISLSSVITSW